MFRVDLFCSGKVDGEAVLTIQLNVTIQTNNYTVLNFKRRKMCYKSESSKTSALSSVSVCRVRCSFQTVTTSPGVDPDATIPLLPTTINNSLSRPDRKHHQHHVNLLQQVVLAVTSKEVTASLHVHVSENISSAVWMMSEKPEGDLLSLPLCRLALAGFIQRCPLAGCGGSFCLAGAEEPPGPLRLLEDRREKMKRPLEIFKNYLGGVVEPPVVHFIVSSTQRGSRSSFFAVEVKVVITR